MPCAPVFWRREGSYQHVHALAQSLAPQAIATAVDAMQMAVAGLAAFLGRSVDSAGRQIEPLLRIHLDARPDARRSVGVDVIVDLGNSRTCVLLREHGADGRRDRLELVYPDDPTVSTPSPFETQSAFFEHEVLPRSAEGVYSFRFLCHRDLNSNTHADDTSTVSCCRLDLGNSGSDLLFCFSVELLVLVVGHGVTAMRVATIVVNPEWIRVSSLSAVYTNSDIASVIIWSSSNHQASACCCGFIASHVVCGIIQRQR
jgi:hypothetical protein